MIIVSTQYPTLTLEPPLILPRWICYITITNPLRIRLQLHDSGLNTEETKHGALVHHLASWHMGRKSGGLHIFFVVVVVSSWLIAWLWGPSDPLTLDPYQSFHSQKKVKKIKTISCGEVIHSTWTSITYFGVSNANYKANFTKESSSVTE